MIDRVKDDWVEDVLGIEMPGPVPKRPGEKLTPLWLDAKSALDGSIDTLQRALREAGDDDLDSIAAYGLHGVTQGQTVRLMAALHEVDTAWSPEAGAKLLAAVRDYRGFLDVAPIIRLLEDENPFVPVPFRQTLGAALDEIERRAAA